MDDLLRRANANRPHAPHSAPEDTAAVLDSIEACLITSDQQSELVAEAGVDDDIL